MWVSRVDLASSRRTRHDETGRGEWGERRGRGDGRLALDHDEHRHCRQLHTARPDPRDRLHRLGPTRTLPAAVVASPSSSFPPSLLVAMSTPQPPPAGAQSTPDANYRAILDYLAKRGHHKAALALSADLDQAANPSRQGSPAAAPPAAGAPQGGGKAVPLDDFAERNAPSAPRQPSAQPPGAAAAGAPQGSATPAPPQPQARRRMDQSVAPGHMLADPPSWDKGYHGLRTFVENSLDIHRPELSPLLLPLFVHSYLDLVLVGYRDAADHFLARFAPDHQPLYPGLVRLLASLRLATHVAENEQAMRWRHERYHVRLSERGWGLLLGWLQGGGLHGASEGTEGRGRDRVLAIINERVKVDGASTSLPLPSLNLCTC